jgi:hypothetical protein
VHFVNFCSVLIISMLSWLGFCPVWHLLFVSMLVMRLVCKSAMLQAGSVPFACVGWLAWTPACGGGLLCLHQIRVCVPCAMCEYGGASVLPSSLLSLCLPSFVILLLVPLEIAGRSWGRILNTDVRCPWTNKRFSVQS